MKGGRRKHKPLFQFRHLELELLTYFLLIFLVSISAITTLIYRNARSTILRLELSRQQSIMSQLAESVNMQFHNAMSFTSIVYYNSSFLETLLEDQRLSGDRHMLNNYFFSMLGINDSILSINFCTNDQVYGMNRSLIRYRPNDPNDSLDEWLARLRDVNDRAAILSTFGSGSSESAYTTLGRIIRDSSGEEMGVLLVDVDIAAPFLEYTGLFADNAYVNRPVTEARGSFVMLDEQQEVLVDTDEAPEFLLSAVASRILEEDSARADDFEISYQGRKYMILYNKLDFCPWTLVYYMDEESLLEDLKKSLSSSIAYVAVIIVLGMLGFGLYTRRMSARINCVLDSMNQYKNGRKDVVIADSRADEIARLASGFNDMIFELNRLIQQVYLFQIEQANARIRSLVNQINPHFIYNILENIQMQAVIHDQHDIAQMVADLGKLIRQNINISGDYVRLEDELELVRAYIELMRVRFNSQFDADIHFDADANRIQMLKFVLQPIVENAILHGIAGADRHCTLRILAYVEDEILHITVSDDGVGMQKAELEVLNRQLADTELTDIHVGLKNVNSRIRLMCGDAFGLRIISSPQSGTTVHITLPVMLPDKAIDVYEQRPQDR